MSADPTAEDLIEESRFARRMIDVMIASVDKVGDIAVRLAEMQTRSSTPARLEVPTVSAAGWNDAVLYVIRAERSKGTGASEIAVMLEQMFGVEVSAQVVLAGVLHFDLDRREVALPNEAPPHATEVEVPAALEQPCGGMTGAEWEAQQAPDAPVDDAAIEPRDWEAEARKLYANGNGLYPFAIAKKLGVEVRDVCCAVLPGFREKQAKRQAKAAAKPAAPAEKSEPEPAAPAPSPSAPLPADPAADWKAEAIRLYDGGKGPTAYAIAKRLGVGDIAVRRLVDPRYSRAKAAQDRKPLGAPIGPRKANNPERELRPVAEGDPALREPWAQEAIKLYDNGLGLSPGSIATKLQVSDFKVRCLLIPGYRDRTQEKVRQNRGNAPRQYARRPAKPTAPPEEPAPASPPAAEPKTAPAPKVAKPARKAISKAPPAPLPWSPPPRAIVDAPADIPAEGNGVHITALEHHHCRFPVGRGADGHETYCGCQKSAHGGSYCDDHARRAFNAWPPRTPLPKLPTRMARQMSAQPAYDTRTTQRRA